MSWRDSDPHPYNGPIRRADGARPYNMYLWPTESWWPSHDEPEFRTVASIFHFQCIELADGRFATEGSVYSIASNSDYNDRPCVFATREAAIRHSAARMIQHIRWARSWEGLDMRLSQDVACKLINWTLRKVAEVCGSPAPRYVNLPILPAPRPEDDLPLFAHSKMTK